MFQFVRDAAHINARNRFSECTQIRTDGSKCVLLCLLTCEESEGLLHIRERPIRVHYQAMYDKAGEYIGTVEFVTDHAEPLEKFCR